MVERLQAEVAKIMVSPELKERLEKLGADPFTMPSAQFNKFIADETAKAQQVVKAAAIKVD
ncbi:Tripartite tricarboxylate transporter family receptor [compost metagenome]